MMLDKKINQTIDALIKKIKDNNLGSIKLSNKTNTIEISNNSINQTLIKILKIFYLTKIKILKMMCK